MFDPGLSQTICKTTIFRKKGVIPPPPPLYLCDGTVRPSGNHTLSNAPGGPLTLVLSGLAVLGLRRTVHLSPTSKYFRQNLGKEFSILCSCRTCKKTKENIDTDHAYNSQRDSDHNFHSSDCSSVFVVSLTNVQWFAVVWTLIYHGLRHHMVKMLWTQPSESATHLYHNI